MRERRKLIFLSLSDLVISITDILSLAALLWIIQFYIQPASGQSAILKGKVSRESFWPIIIFFALFSAKNIIAFVITRWQYNFTAQVAVRLSKNALLAFQNISYKEYVEEDSSAYIKRIAFQPFEFCQYVLGGIQQLFTQLSLILIASIAITIFNAQLFLLLLLILLPPAALVFYFIKRKLEKTRLEVQQSNQDSFRSLLDALKGWVEGHLYARHSFFLKRFIAFRKKFSHAMFQSLSWQSLPGRFIEIFAVMGLFLLIVIARWYGQEDSESFLTIGAFMAAAYKIIPGVVKIINVSGQIKAYENSLALLRLSDIDHATEKGTSKPVQSIICENLSFQYGEQFILQNIDLAINAGDFIGIKGRSGTGKTTLINLLLGFLEPQEGCIKINGCARHSVGLKNYWSRVAYVRQQSFFIHDTVLENITLGETHAERQRIDQAIKVSGIQEMLEETGEGLDKIIMENGKNISGGQQQRIAIARSLYKDADVYLLDEPFNELDEFSEKKLLIHFRDLARKGKIVVMITHNTSSFSYCNKIISLDD